MSARTLKPFYHLKVLRGSSFWTEIIFIISWSLLSYSIIQCIEVFILIVQSKLLYYVLIGLVHISFYFLCVTLLARKYRQQFNYGQYLAISVLYGLLIWLYSFLFFVLFKITDLGFDFDRYLILLVLNLILSSIVFSKTMKSKE
jgi:hypothetical protein